MEPLPFQSPCHAYSSNVSSSSGMEVEAPLPCSESGCRALLRTCGRWTDRYFFKNPILLLDPKKQPPADILSDDNHEESPVDITKWEEVKWDSINGWTSEELKFTAMPSSEGGLDNYNGSQVLHMEEHLSIVHPVLQMLLFASCDPGSVPIIKDECAFNCQKSMLPERELGMDNKSLSSPITKQTPEVYTKGDAPGNGDSFVQESGDFFGVITEADNQHGIGRNVARKQIFKQSKTCGGGSGSKPDDDFDKKQQQRQQQHVDSFGMVVHLWPSEVAPTHSVVVNEDCLGAVHWETMFDTMNWLNLPGTMNCNSNSGCMTISRMSLNEQRSLEDTYQTPQRTDGAPVINFTEEKGEPKLHSIFRSSVTDLDDSISTALKNAPAATATTWIIASAAPHHATGNRALLSDFTPEHSEIFLLGGEAEAMPMQVVGRGVVVTKTMVLPDVWYVPGLVANLVSVSQLSELDYSVAFGRGECYIRSTMDGTTIGAAHRGRWPVCP